jgi:hypothetical protein
MARLARHRSRPLSLVTTEGSRRWPGKPTDRLRAEASAAIDVSRVVHVARDALTVGLCYVAALPFTAGLLTGAVLPPSFLLPTAIVLVALLLTQPRQWWALLAATLVGHWAAAAANHDPTGAMPGFAMGAVCAIAAAALTRRFVDLSSGLGSLRSMGSFMMVAVLAPVVCMLGPAIAFRIRRLPNFAASASGGVLAIDWTPWFVATLGATLAFVTIVPAAVSGFGAARVAVTNFPRAVLPWTRVIEAVALTAAVAVSSIVAFNDVPFSGPQVLLLIAPLSLVL